MLILQIEKKNINKSIDILNMENESNQKINLPFNQMGTLAQRKRGQSPLNVTIHQI